MKLYKLQHIPTGLFFTPSKGNGNLSKKGKIYVNIKPRLEWVESIRIRFYTDRPTKQTKVLTEYFNLDVNGYSVDTYIKTNPEDWRILEITE